MIVNVLPRFRFSHRLALFLIGAYILSFYNAPDFYGRELSSIFESESSESPGADENDPKCPAVVERMKGIYKNAIDDPEKKFGNVILVTAASSGFEDYLRNWELHAEDFNLKWLTVAFDNEIYKSRNGPEKNILISHDNQEKEIQSFGNKGYYKLVCNKMRIVLEILESCNIDVMFSDTDIAFAKDPFKYELGDKIASGQFDYIFQHNVNKWSNSPGEHPCIREGYSPDEGNTGFHYLKPTKEMKNLIRKTLTMCEKEEIDDQSAFWKIMKNSTDEWNYCPPHAGSKEYAPREEGKNQFCCLDPYYYPVAHLKPENIDDIVLLHANWATGNNKKWKLKTWMKDGWRLPFVYT